MVLAYEAYVIHYAFFSQLVTSLSQSEVGFPSLDSEKKSGINESRLAWQLLPKLFLSSAQLAELNNPVWMLYLTAISLVWIQRLPHVFCATDKVSKPLTKSLTIPEQLLWSLGLSLMLCWCHGQGLLYAVIRKCMNAKQSLLTLNIVFGAEWCRMNVQKRVQFLYIRGVQTMAQGPNASLSLILIGPQQVLEIKWNMAQILAWSLCSAVLHFLVSA